jgi:glycosyltransferase involved in cell wall biosynthesis
MAAVMEAVRAPNIELIDRTLCYDELEKLYQASDVLVSLHRSEGFGLPIAEAMLHGLPVVATAWSGSVDFVDATVGVPIPCTLIAAEDEQMITLAWCGPMPTSRLPLWRCAVCVMIQVLRPA